MKYIKYLLLTILLIPLSVFAYEIKCDSTSTPYKHEDTFSCILTGNPNVAYDELSGGLEKDATSNLECTIEKVDNGLELNESGTNSATEFSYKGTLNQEVIAKYNCKVAVKPTTSKQEQLIIPNLKENISDDNKDATTQVIRSNAVNIQEYIETPTGETKPRDTSNPDTRAKSVVINGDESIFTFSSFKAIYDIEVRYEVSEISLFIVPNNENATYEVQGNSQLEIGMNVIDIYIISPDQQSKTCYTLNIKRLKRGEEIYYPDKNSDLADLKIEGYPINFESVILEYKIHLTHDVSDVKITATPKESGSKVEISNTSNLYNGAKIDVIVTSADGSSSTTYTIKVTKDAPPKDYRNVIYFGAIIIAIIIVIIIIIITNTRNKNNPLIRSKKKEEKTEVPPAQPVETPTVEVSVQPTPVAPPEVNIQEPVQPVPMPQVESQNNTTINQ